MKMLRLVLMAELLRKIVCFHRFYTRGANLSITPYETIDSPKIITNGNTETYVFANYTRYGLPYAFFQLQYASGTWSYIGSSSDSIPTGLILAQDPEDIPSTNYYIYATN